MWSVFWSSGGCFQEVCVCVRETECSVWQGRESRLIVSVDKHDGTRTEHHCSPFIQRAVTTCVCRFCWLTNIFGSEEMELQLNLLSQSETWSCDLSAHCVLCCSSSLSWWTSFDIHEVVWWTSAYLYCRSDLMIGSERWGDGVFVKLLCSWSEEWKFSRQAGGSGEPTVWLKPGTFLWTVCPDKEVEKRQAVMACDYFQIKLKVSPAPFSNIRLSLHTHLRLQLL